MGYWDGVWGGITSQHVDIAVVLALTMLPTSRHLRRINRLTGKDFRPAVIGSVMTQVRSFRPPARPRKVKRTRATLITWSGANKTILIQRNRVVGDCVINERTSPGKGLCSAVALCTLYSVLCTTTTWRWPPRPIKDVGCHDHVNDGEPRTWGEESRMPTAVEVTLPDQP